jgi:hypothetical protein
MPASFDQPERWRERAAQMRTVADAMGDLVARTSMLEIADQYDRHVDRAEQRVQSQKAAA